jgi:GMP synthase-like glutamine amidotransferase
MNYLDVGSMFGMPTAEVFEGTNTTVLRPQTSDALMVALDKADMVGFGGGADIHPSLYGCKNVASGVGHGPSVRDRVEEHIFRRCVDDGIPMFGICRGAQFLCAMSGGKLVQDVTGHGGDHTLNSFNGLMMPITSTHHQMMYPWDVPHDLIAWTANKSQRYIHDIPNYTQPDKDPEIVFFPRTGAFAVQGHPEWMDPNSKTVRMIRTWVQEKFSIQL